jgi:hypothetical protein
VFLSSSPSKDFGPQGVGEVEEAAGVYAETKIEELAERKFGSIIRSSPSQKTNDADENHRPHRLDVGRRT